nr:DUF4405 domain-containing protein [uncultured Rhodoferax sp.]
MNRVFLLRLALDGVAAGLLLFAFAYYWQGNAAHEVAGTAMFLFLIVHGAFHRRWFSTLTKKKSNVQRSKFNIALTFVLLIGMCALLVTSLVISETVFADWRWEDDFTVRRLHAGAAYWLLVVVAIHLGLRWPLLMATASRLFGITQPNRARTVLLRVITLCIAVQGVGSAQALNLPAKLLFQMSLDWWDFGTSVAGFFGHCIVFAGLCICVTYYGVRWQQRRKHQPAF